MGLVTFAITPRASSLSDSSFSVLFRASGVSLGGMATGVKLHQYLSEVFLACDQDPQTHQRNSS